VKQNNFLEHIKVLFQKLVQLVRDFFAPKSRQAKPLEPHVDASLSLPQPPATPLTELPLGSPVLPEYRKSKSLLTFRERILHSALRRANDNDYALFVKVRLGDFVYLANEPQDRKFHVNQILCKHVDFLFCDKVTLEPLLVVELDDSTHKQPDHHERDKFKEETFSAIHLPLLRISVQSDYNQQWLRKQIQELIRPSA
jgi:hypothetical protein